MSIELGAAEAYIWRTLSSDASLRAAGIQGYYSSAAPAQVPTPYILWSFYSAVDTMGIGTIRVNVQIVYIVRVVDRVQSFLPLQSAADRIDALLHGSTGTISGHVIEGCVRESPYELVEDQTDVQWRHLGGRYRFWVS